jgi:cytochrome c biogenesis protein CcmG/thiol:disulfide interchange protein DsbE
MKAISIFTIFILSMTGVVYGQSSPANKPPLAVGAKAPVLKVDEWFSEKPDLKGKFIALDFWGVSCKPCIAGFAHVNELNKKFKDKVAFIATTTDNPENVYVFESGPEIEFYSMILKTWDEYSINGIPHMIVIDPKGIVRFSGNGFDLSEAKLDQIIKNYGN